MRGYIIAAVAALAAFGLYRLLEAQSGIDAAAAKGLAVLFFIASLWLSEAFHISVTALLVPLLTVGTGLLDTRQALSSFAHPIIFLFMGGFAMAAALQKQQLDRWFAQTLMRVFRGHFLLSALAICLTTAFLSMWISNTATAAMMLPIVLGLIQASDEDISPESSIFLLLAVAYSASIGGMATLVGSPPNAIAAAEMGLSFMSWLRIGLPVSLVLLPLVLVTLGLVLRPQFPRVWQGAGLVSASRSQWNGQRVAVAVIFALVVSGWVFGKPLAGALGGLKSIDSLVAVAAIVALIASRLLSWKEFEQHTDWGVLILFGGGITLSVMLSESGASAVLAEQLVGSMSAYPAWVFLFAAIALMIFLTELASNTASAALMVPILLALPAEQLQIAPGQLALAVSFAASCAFMLPVATPPNALVYGTGRVPQRQMMRAGLVLNLVCLLTLGLFFI